jgi:hypothetical protein
LIDGSNGGAPTDSSCDGEVLIIVIAMLCELSSELAVAVDGAAAASATTTNTSAAAVE